MPNFGGSLFCLCEHSKSDKERWERMESDIREGKARRRGRDASCRWGP